MDEMLEEYDFGNGKRGAVRQPLPGKTRITIRIDDDVLEWFRRQIEVAGGEKSYQTMINQALREYMMREREPLESILRRVVREELASYNANESTAQANDDPR